MVTVLKRMSRHIFVSLILLGVVATNVYALGITVSKQPHFSSQSYENPICFSFLRTDIASFDVENCHAFIQGFLASTEKFTLSGEQNLTFEPVALQIRTVRQAIYRDISEQNLDCFSRPMTLDGIVTKINSGAALGNQKCFWPSAALIKLNWNVEDILVVVLDKHFSSK